MGAIEKWAKGEYGKPTSSTPHRKPSRALGKQYVYTRRKNPHQSLEVKRTREGTFIEVSKIGDGTRWGEIGGQIIKTPVNQAYYLRLEQLISKMKARREGPRVECRCGISHNTA